MNAAEAEIVALKALTFLAHSDDELSRFVTLSGIAPADLRARAGDPEILAAVLDFVLADDGRVSEFCALAEIDPPAVHRARQALPGA